MKIEEKYRDWLFGLKDKPLTVSEKEELDAVWAEIEEELILDETWSGIEKSLMEGDTVPDHKHRKTTIYRTGFLALFGLLLIALFLLVNLHFEDQKNAEIFEKDLNTDLKKPQMENQPYERNIVPEENESPVSTHTKSQLDESSETGSVKLDNDILSEREKKIEYDEEIHSDKDMISGKSSGDKFINSILSEESYTIAAEEDEAPSGMEYDRREGIQGIPLAQLSDKTIKDLSLPFLFPDHQDLSLKTEGILPYVSAKPILKFLSAGVSVSYNNSWILNDKTISGLRSEDLSRTRLSYAPEIGFNAVFSSPKNHRLELEVFFISEQNQRYNEYINALYQERTISLHYHKMHASWLFPVKIIPMHAGIGAYYSVLNRAEEIIADREEQITALYSKDDYGLSLQFAHEFYPRGNWVVTPSLRFQYSFHNVFNGNQVIPASMLKTNNASVGLNLSINYRF